MPLLEFELAQAINIFFGYAELTGIHCVVSCICIKLIIKILAIKCGAAAISVGSGSFILTLGVTFIPKSMDALFGLLEKYGGTFQGENAIKFKVENIQEIEKIINEVSAVRL